MVDLDSETLFNAAAAFVATVAVLYFILNVDPDISPVSTVSLVAAFLAVILVITQRSSDYQLVVLGYGIIVTSVLALFFDLMSTFDVGNELTVVGLLVLAALLFGLRTRLDGDGHFVTGQQATYAFVVVALTIAILLVDVATGGLAYELQANATVEYAGEPHGELVIGAVTASNPTPFPERVEIPRYAACPGGNWSEFAPPSDHDAPERQVRLSLRVTDGYNEHVTSYGTRTYPVLLNLHGGNLTGETFPIERTDGCPEQDSGDPYVAVFEASAERPYRYAV